VAPPDFHVRTLERDLAERLCWFTCHRGSGFTAAPERSLYQRNSRTDPRMHWMAEIHWEVWLDCHISSVLRASEAPTRPLLQARESTLGLLFSLGHPGTVPVG
jgi:hypothetical protein